ncbi:malonate--CoA ligase ACSF3, mitochondrial [Pieris brassicae]|uniref:malonate--CoA ligase ACSF3, mitochondrial n=1 Tax=Pieris brassicae TaxID=7116 RepID=UPI001E661AE5|nr:malonate--CoA ligase ACSF3, mitochondrial [Pieris brassicae]
MGLIFRPHTYHRLFRKHIGICFKRTCHAAPKKENNLDLLNSFNQDVKTGGVIPVFRRALLFPSRVAVQDDSGTFTYAGLYHAANDLSRDIAAQLLGETERTIGYLCGNNVSHVITQWAIWMTGNIAVPLTPIHPPEMLKYFITDSDAGLVICTKEHENLLRPVTSELSKPLLVSDRDKDKDEVPNHWKPETGLGETGPTNLWYGGKDAMLIYTSGTTSKPKGVVWTHRMLATQIAALHSAWQYSANDVVLHTLPLHHIHGQLNSLNATLAAGARIRMLPSFASHTVWSRLLGKGSEEARITVFHGVPAMYARLAADHSALFKDSKTVEYVRNTLSKMRLMCAGSAPLPETLFNKWEEISGLRLLERYGMSEVGMALSNPYRPVEKRRVGCVGTPLPGVSARIAAPRDEGLRPLVTVESRAPDLRISPERLSVAEGLVENEDRAEVKVTVHEKEGDGAIEGELLLKGPNVFTRYWNRAPSVDGADFTSDGWFRTGDVASFSNGSFKILGRSSVDIIKTGGYKVSAVQVESAILEHPSVADVAVLGIEDDSLGEIVSAVIQSKENESVSLQQLKDVVGKKLAPYQLPRTMLTVEKMPRNAMGKLDKKEIRRLFAKDLVFKRSQ